MANGTIAASQLEMLSLSGTGIITITPPATNTNRAITLPDAAGALVVSGTTPSLNGITFPATQVPSADANTLDDYEEGTWTPVATSAGGTITSYTSSGNYTKIGNSVTVNFRVLITNNGSGAAGILITGFPFSAKTSQTLAGATREDQAVGFGVVGSPTNATTLFLSKYDSFYPGGTNYGFSFCITYVI